MRLYITISLAAMLSYSLSGCNSGSTSTLLDPGALTSALTSNASPDVQPLSIGQARSAAMNGMNEIDTHPYCLFVFHNSLDSRKYIDAVTFCAADDGTPRSSFIIKKVNTDMIHIQSTQQEKVIDYYILNKNIRSISHRREGFAQVNYFSMSDISCNCVYVMDYYHEPEVLAFSSALAALSQYAEEQSRRWAAEFPDVASKYRAMTKKPADVPEEVIKYDVLARSAIVEKRFVDADEFLVQGIDATPWWPPFHFNRALVLGELQIYADAALEMQRYLALVPDAPNGREAQNKIYIWQSKAGALQTD